MNSASPANARIVAFVLMLGNFVTALSIMNPAGMLSDLSHGLGVSIRDVSLLVTFGAVVLFLGSPLMVWATSGVDRRRLLSVAVLAIVLGHIASMLAPNFALLLTARLAMLVLSAVFTPVAASTISALVAEKDRASAISFVFLGWSIALACGLPIITFISAHVGWRETYGVLALASIAVLALTFIFVPAGMRGTPLSLQSWAAIGRNPLILLLLFITILWVSGQFVLFTFLGPLTTALTGGGAELIGIFFAVMGAMGFVGNVAATRIVLRAGTFNTGLIFLLAMFVGTMIWAVGAGTVAAMAAGVATWGCGFAAFNSMQQARLVAAAPALASATVALNTSSNYVGQAIGSALGAELFMRGHLLAMGYAATGFMLLALAAFIASRRPAG
jgi:predicted MFS family arabinose efflux permease